MLQAIDVLNAGLPVQLQGPCPGCHGGGCAECRQATPAPQGAASGGGGRCGGDQGTAVKAGQKDLALAAGFCLAPLDAQFGFAGWLKMEGGKASNSCGSMSGVCDSQNRMIDCQG